MHEDMTLSTVYARIDLTLSNSMLRYYWWRSKPTTVQEVGELSRANEKQTF